MNGQNPEEFNTLTAYFIPHADEIYTSVEEIIDDGWQELSAQQQKVARDFLDEILSGTYTESQLRAIWRASRAAISPFRGRQGDCRKLLELIRSRYDVNAHAGGGIE